MKTMDDIPCREHEGKNRDELAKILEDDELALTPDAWFEDPYAGRDTPEGRRRRRAVQACHLDCPTVARLGCLLEGIKPDNQTDGIFGGYLPVERREILAEAESRGVDIRTNIAKMIESTKASGPAR